MVLGAKKAGGESVYSVSTADGYVEEEPNVGDWLRDTFLFTPRDVLHYFRSLFPFIEWMPRYNLKWLAGDAVAGITVGAVVIPQSMAYAKLAQLPPEYGLYSSFMGVLIYWFFATSKDITIGPVAVLSTLVGNVVLRVEKQHPQYERHVIASALSIIAGSIVTFIGLTRLGWIVEFISLTAIAAFMTGSAISIAAGQVPALMGITGVSNRDPTYRVIINTLKALPRTKIDAAMGLSALTLLYIIRFACSYAAKKQPHRQKTYFFISTLRTAFVILLYVLISWLVNRNRRSKPLFAILGNVPRGFKHAAVPVVDKTLLSSFASELPATVIVILIEHISISKSFGRINNYVINPSQELVAMGVTNLLGPFLGGYPATGSFSRTAIKSKAGVRTPFAGVITALVVLISIYALPSVFFYIPSASLSGVIIHAVGDLITPPKTLIKFWKISPLEVPIFFAGVLVTVFTSIENGIYTTVACSAAVMLYRIFKAKGHFLGPVKIRSIIADPSRSNSSGDVNKDYGTTTRNGKHSDLADTTHHRHAFLPLDHYDGSNPGIELEAPYPGVFIFRFSEGYTYPNANHYLELLTHEIFKSTRRTNLQSFPKIGDRPWNDPGPKRGEELKDDDRPTLKAIILDFSSVNVVDITSVQNLIDVRNQLDKHASPDAVEWHFASVNNRWTKRALAAAGFGFPPATGDGEAGQRWQAIFSVAEIGGDDSAAKVAEAKELQKARKASDIEGGHHGIDIGNQSDSQRRILAVHGLNLPFFHVDLTSAVQSAIHSISNRGYGGRSNSNLS